MPPIKHIHSYRRAKLGKSIIYKCLDSGCTHFIQKALIEGRTCICSRCGKPFIITKKTLKDCPASPHCKSCYGGTNLMSKENKALDEALDQIIVD